MKWEGLQKLTAAPLLNSPNFSYVRKCNNTSNGLFSLLWYYTLIPIHIPRKGTLPICTLHISIRNILKEIILKYELNIPWLVSFLSTGLHVRVGNQGIHIKVFGDKNFVWTGNIWAEQFCINTFATFNSKIPYFPRLSI